MKSIFVWVSERISPYYLVHVLLDGAHANTYIKGNLGDFVVKQRKAGRSIVVVGAWKISRREYMALANA